MNVTPILPLIDSFVDGLEIDNENKRHEKEHRRRSDNAIRLFDTDYLPHATVEELFAFLQDTDAWYGARNKPWLQKVWFGEQGENLSAFRTKLGDLIRQASTEFSGVHFNQFLGEKKIAGFGPAFLSEILCLRFPDRYWIMNWPIKEFVSTTGVDIRDELPIGKKSNPGEQYIAYGRHIDDLQSVLGEKLGKTADYLLADQFMWWALRFHKDTLLDAFKKMDGVLAFPFNELFADWKEANAAFDLLLAILEKLGVSPKNDRRFAVTLPQFSNGRRCLRLDFGRAVAVDFERRQSSQTMIRIRLQGAYESENRFIGFNPITKNLIDIQDDGYRFELSNPSDPQIETYTIPFQRLLEILEENPGIQDTGLQNMVMRYGKMQGSPSRRYNIPVIASSIFDIEKRKQLLSTGFQEVVVEGGEKTVKVAFHDRTFELMEGIHRTPLYSYYKANKDYFVAFVEEPLKNLMKSVAPQLPKQILDTIETEKDVFSKFNKNDYGKGGAWPHYWGAFYPKGGKRTADPQLALFLNHERMDVSFYIGEYGNEARQRFARNTRNYASVLPTILQDLIKNTDILIEQSQNIHIEPDGVVTTTNSINWQEWFQDPAKSAFGVRMVLPKDELLNTALDDLVTLIKDAFVQFFPLVLLSISEDPLPEIKRYLEIDVAEPEINDEYPLEMLSEDSGIAQDILERWVRAIERKKQAIFYGPPGTGKTYMARQLAQHLIGGDDGFMEILQFHPEYSYEDFMQGIRPRPHPSGGLDYPMESGRFLDFCRKAKERHGNCVLIIDEINRANLARVFGELMYLLEYREESVPLAGGGRFSIPENVLVLGTMNTADRSIALVDHALRRRFAFLELTPNYELLSQYHQQKGTGFETSGLVQVLKELNEHIGDPYYLVGITYFLVEKNLAGQIEDIWRMEIEPYLEEYFYGQNDKAKKFSWEKVASKILPM